MSDEKITGVAAIVFDAYGTLLDTGSATGHLRKEIGEDAAPIARVWRQKQLEYTWLRSLMHQFEDFWHVTGESLDYALAVHKINNPVLRSRLMEQYLRLDAFPDARECLSVLKQHGCRTGLLSNGSTTMLAAAIGSADLRELLDVTLSVDQVKVYKPDPRTYHLVTDYLGLAPEEILFVSGNQWDIAGAHAFGFRTVWLDRNGEPAETIAGAKPVMTMKSLTELPNRIVMPKD